MTLSFNNVHERLEIPLGAITTFADPSVNFALQFQPLVNAQESEDEPVAQSPKRPALKAVKPGEESDPQAAPLRKVPAVAVKKTEAEAEAERPADAPPAEEPRGQVVALDAFRKK